MAHQIEITKQYWAPIEVARRFDVSDRMIRNLINRGALKALRIGGVFRIHHDDLEAFIRRCQVESIDEEVRSVEYQDAAERLGELA